MDKSDATVHWRTWSRDNVISIFGYDTAFRVADPSKPTHVFSWLLQATVDPRGNAIAYEYKQEDTVGAPRAAHERSRGGPQAARHPKRCLWGNLTPQADVLDFWDIDRELTPSDWLFELVFDYGEHADQDPQPDDAGGWLHRPDAFSRSRSGFEVRTRRLCRRVLMFHRMAELHASLPTLVRSLDLSYEERAEGSRLLSVQSRGWVRVPSGGYTTLARPAVDFTWTDRRPSAPPQPLRTSDAEPLPARFSDGAFRFVDLDGEGLPGLLRVDSDAWTYRRNLGEGRFGPSQRLPSRPALAELRSGVRQLAEIDGSGRMALVQYQAGASGFHARRADGSWAGFRPFRKLPNLDFSDPDLRFVDLTGDGRPDLLITEREVFRWWPSLGPDGFGEPSWARLLGGEDAAPRVVFTDPSQAVLFADMTGDGLQDLVRVRRGQVCYWPNLGYGRFGAQVVMDAPPRLGNIDTFDPARLRLVDADGTGPADLIYIGRDRARVWFNRSGNSWSEPESLPAWPPGVDPATVQVADILGHGSACLLWESPTSGSRRIAAWFLPLLRPGPSSTDTAPNLLKSVTNNLGAVTTITYRPSTAFYLEAKAAGRPWATRLGFPVQVVSQIRIEDQISDTRLLRSFAYHHGYWDPVEREFRGFGRVESWDAESFADDANPNTRDERPPVRTVTWFHTGAWFEKGTLGEAYAREYYAGDADAVELADTVLPAGLTAPERREACRALKGRPLRVEVYGDDGSAEQDVPYTVAESNHGLLLVQPRWGDEHPVFLPHPRESLTLTYERLTAGGHDPRATHELVLAVDAFGNVTRKASVAYARRASAGLPEQDTTKVVVTETGFVNDTDQDDWLRIGVPWRVASYEITRPAPSVGDPGKDDRTPFILGPLASDVGTALSAPLGWDEAPSFTGPEARRLSFQVTVFRADNQTPPITPLPLGELESLALPFRQYTMVLPESLRASVFDSDVDPADLEEGGYRTSADWLTEVYSPTSIPASSRSSTRASPSASAAGCRWSAPTAS